ncbi:MAG: asparagine synthase (glutamine-hydrolyzing) [Intestinimonas butyriciproducens]|uniref:asparagine synthase (glutamine-hydrolyzing) n=1 Tax=Intestinimonas butyriciproducens TaxID=1297617 RepID=UPI003996384E|nr:asparagine synthase (glutamine-hydrolyzing) [Clostridiales bacterium]
MCGIAGFISFDRDNGRPQWAAIAHSMGEALNHRGPDDKGTWLCPAGALIHRRLAVIDPDRGRQPMTRTRDCAEYTIVYNGELYNTDALRRELSDQGYRFETSSDTEVLLTAYMAWGEEVPARLEGIYAFVIWDGVRNQFFACRDRFGVKPFFYALADDGALVFGSELKALFQYPGLTPRMDAAGWCEVLGIGPARTSGCGVFSGVKELEPAHSMTISRGGVRKRRYWSLESRPHTDDYEDTVLRVRELVTGAITRQLVSDVPLCTFLSGGLDSSVITAVAARDYQRRGLPALETYSFDYTDNAKYFTPSSFQPDADQPWVERMTEAFHTRHTVLTCPIPDLCALLDDAVAAKDLPGMADVDSSLLYFCRRVAERHVVALSGECADEVFGGYPWFERPEMLHADTFPWCRDLDARREVFDAGLWKRLGVSDYVDYRYRASVAQTPRLEGEDPENARRREVAWLNLNWFMTTLLDRKDRMSMASGLEVRVPFCDHHLVEYVWNIPWSMKAMNGRRKQVLRDTAEGLLPEDVRTRPKSPYPKTHNPLYEELVRARLATILDDPAAPLHALVNARALREGLLTSAGDYGRPWFGQLMAGPQMLAYLVQLNVWMERFHLTV